MSDHVRNLAITWHPFDDLSPRALHDVLKLRGDVFVTEQACPFSDIDGRDPAAVHALAERAGELAATARLIPEGDDTVRVGRFVTHPDARGQGVGAALMRGALAEIDRRWGAVTVILGAQTRVQGFYERFGFVPRSHLVSGCRYVEDGIPHIEMGLELHGAAPIE